MQERADNSPGGLSRRAAPSSSPASTLVIVSEGGRHSNESRRIVRAQAARASAAQSRVTRARNREERRDGVAGGTPPSPSPGPPDLPPVPNPSNHDPDPDSMLAQAHRPLVVWLSGLLNMSAQQLIHHARDPTSASQDGVRAATSNGPAGAISGFGSFLDAKGGRNERRPQLPLAIPRGFVALQSRLHVSDGLMALLGRTSCFDFISPGTEARLQQLLLDLTFQSHDPTAPGACDSPIEAYLRIACISMSIFQGQYTDAAVFARDNRYQRGLEAAWSEAWLLDQNSLRTPQSAEASLWAVFIISVTTGTGSNLFRPLLCTLLQDLRLSSWFEVRSVLLAFIYPVSLLDGPCRLLYDALF